MTESPVVEVEYCNKCGYYSKYEELKKHMEENHPNAIFHGREGRRGSFEVEVNGCLVHSKLQTLAYPDYNDLSNIIRETEKGRPVRSPCKQQPITSCSIT